MKIRKGKIAISESNIKKILDDVVLSRVLFHFIESLKQLYPEKFEIEVPTKDIYEVDGAIDFQYVRLYKEMESDYHFKEYVIKLLNDQVYREVQIDDYFTCEKPLYSV